MSPSQPRPHQADSVFMPFVEQFQKQFGSSASATTTDVVAAVPSGVLRRLRNTCGWLAQFQESVSVPDDVLLAVQRHFGQDPPALWSENDVRVALHSGLNDLKQQHLAHVFRITRQLNRQRLAAFTPDEFSRLVRRVVWLVLAFYESGRASQQQQQSSAAATEGNDQWGEVGNFIPVQALAVQLVHMEDMPHFAQCFVSTRQDPSLRRICGKLAHYCQWLNACHDVARLEESGWGEYALSCMLGNSWAKTLPGTPLDWPLLPAILSAANLSSDDVGDVAASSATASSATSASASSATTAVPRSYAAAVLHLS